MMKNEVLVLEWSWIIPRPFIPRVNLEDMFESYYHHYDLSYYEVRLSDYHKIQEADRGWKGRLDLHISRRMRKVPTLPDETKISVVLSNDGGKKELTEQLFRDPNV